MSAPGVSIAIATYNRAEMVGQAIEAALTQSLPPTEVCVSDDASIDSTWEVLASFASSEPRLRVFRRAENSGGVDNWNFAIAQTAGDYIAWCSDDDRYLPDHLEASIRYLEASPHTGLVYSGFIDAVETESSSLTIPRKLRFPENYVLSSNNLLPYLTRYYDWPFHPSTIVMRRSVWDKVGPFDSTYALADTDWFVRAIEQFPAAMLARHGVVNRRHRGNWSNRLGSARMQREIFAIVNASIDRMFAQRPVRRTTWKIIWRWNVRLRLLLTVLARVSSGHADAACNAWSQMIESTKMPIPTRLARVVDRIIRMIAARHAASFRDPRESVSPL
jgi:glycosyltransferase involved in cell wall biosynthesis